MSTLTIFLVLKKKSIELPDENLDPEGILSELVKTHMTHGPCGHIDPGCVCMKDKNDGRGRKCKAGYPKQFQEGTSIQEDGYPLLLVSAMDVPAA